MKFGHPIAVILFGVGDSSPYYSDNTFRSKHKNNPSLFSLNLLSYICKYEKHERYIGTFRFRCVESYRGENRRRSQSRAALFHVSHLRNIRFTYHYIFVSRFLDEYQALRQKRKKYYF